MVSNDGAKATTALPVKDSITNGQVLARRYKVIEAIGAGAMGQVYKVADQSMDEQIFAIKVLPPEAAGDEGAVERLKKEAQAAINLNHPHIMGVNYFEASGETKFIVMEYLDGPNLDVALAHQDQFTEEQVIELAQGLCPALDYAHERKIIHRDIKPANLIFTKEGEKEVVKLADFGIAFRLRETMTKLTGQGSTGTLLYVPPEQLKGMPTDSRADQYSLAVTFYELLSGDPPFRGPTAAITEQIKNVKAQPIEGVSAHVNKALSRAMAKDPKARFDSCAEFLQALEGKALPEPMVIRGGKSGSLRQLIIVAAVFLLLLFVINRPRKRELTHGDYGKLFNEMLIKKDYGKIQKYFHEKLAAKLSEGKLKADWERVSKKAGRYHGTQDELTVKDSELKGCKLVIVTNQFTKGRMHNEFTIDERIRLLGIMFRLRPYPEQTRALNVAKLLEAQNWVELRKLFSPKLDKMLSTKKLAADWNKNRKPMNRFVKSEVTKLGPYNKKGLPIPHVKASYTNGHIMVKPTFFGSKLERLYFKAVLDAKALVPTVASKEPPRKHTVRKRTLFFASFFPGKAFNVLLDKSPLLKKTLTKEKLAQDWKNVAGEPGELRDWSNFRHIRKGREDIGLVINTFENCKIEFKFHFDKHIQGLTKLYFRRLPKESSGS